MDYRGEIFVPLYNDSKTVQYVEHGERIAQILFKEVPEFHIQEVLSLEETARGDGGFGSTGTM